MCVFLYFNSRKGCLGFLGERKGYFSRQLVICLDGTAVPWFYSVAHQKAEAPGRQICLNL